MALYIFSDAHLGTANHDLEQKKIAHIEELFEMVSMDGDRLIILGDLFDFWFEYKHAIPKEHLKILRLLAGLVESGIKVDYICGNHDFWMGDFFEREVGLNLHRDSLDTEYDGRRLHLIHGDGLAKADRGYRLLKRVLRNPVNIWLYQKLPPDWAIPLAKFVSGTSRDYTSKRDSTFALDYEMYAKGKLEDQYDVVAIGHLHIPVFKEYDSGVYINTGDFINHFSYAKMSNGMIALEFLE